MGFWTGENVTILGGAGFLGAHLTKALLDVGARVTVIDGFNRGKNRLEGARYLKADIGDSDRTPVLYEKAFAVFNLAAHVAGVIYNQRNHLEMYHENMRLLTAPLLASEQAGVERFLQVSSVCAYAPEHLAPCEEQNGSKGEPTKANEGYSWAKRMGERVALWANIPRVVIARPSNLFGPGDYFDERAHVIPALIRKTVEDDVIRVNGTGQERREFLYVEDAALGLMAALEHGEHREAYNVGTDGATCATIEQIVTMIKHYAKQEHKPVVFESAHDPGDSARWSDCSKIHALGWQHKTGLATGLQLTTTWYMAQREKVTA